MILGSKQQFIRRYLDGTKIHSIRKGHRWRKGMTIHYYEKVRQPGMRKFMPDGICTGVQDIEINLVPTEDRKGWYHEVKVDGRPLDKRAITVLSMNDGFDSSHELFNFFGLQFKGQIIHWTDWRY